MRPAGLAVLKGFTCVAAFSSIILALLGSSLAAIGFNSAENRKTDASADTWSDEDDSTGSSSGRHHYYYGAAEWRQLSQLSQFLQFPRIVFLQPRRAAGLDRMGTWGSMRTRPSLWRTLAGLIDPRLLHM